MICYLLCTWCVLKAGPLFCSMFKPVAIIFTAFMGAIFLGDDFSLGSLIGAVIFVVGFYAVLWGKSKEESEIAIGVENLESPCHNVPLLQDRNRYPVFGCSTKISLASTLKMNCRYLISYEAYPILPFY
ncbi:WAT1-related protein At5g40210-like [Vigna radiata var. radiata]|uniref:WAT1-related protein At5g40210-like n=1 Tax=Vigna radiata var. radiata TaxID=3916 RepID=A0A3Q0EK01_VIGRR|nr:WAT1-related protein At5g40210-like [Vigna radiata var. radiata]